MTMLDVFAFPGLDNSGRLKEYRIESADRARKRISDRRRAAELTRRAMALICARRRLEGRQEI